jgi:hypothetical protein
MRNEEPRLAGSQHCFVPYELLRAETRAHGSAQFDSSWDWVLEESCSACGNGGRSTHELMSGGDVGEGN